MRKIMLGLLSLIVFYGVRSQPTFCNYHALAEQKKQTIIQYFEHLDSTKFRSYNQVLLLRHLSVKYSLNLKVPFDKLLRNPQIVQAEDTLVKKYFHRLVERSFKPSLKALKKDYDQSKGIEHLLLWGLYADVLPFDEECQNTIEQPVGYDAYSLRLICHILLPFYWAKQRNAVQPTIQKEFETRFAHQWKPSLIKGLEYEKGFSDSGMEGLLAFFFAGQPEHIPLSSVEQFLFYPSPDGGYPWDLDHPQSEFHPSLLALWLVCELTTHCNEH